MADLKKLKKKIKYFQSGHDDVKFFEEDDGDSLYTHVLVFRQMDKFDVSIT